MAASSRSTVRSGAVCMRLRLGMTCAIVMSFRVPTGAARIEAGHRSLTVAARIEAGAALYCFLLGLYYEARGCKQTARGRCLNYEVANARSAITHEVLPTHG